MIVQDQYPQSRVLSNEMFIGLKQNKSRSGWFYMRHDFEQCMKKTCFNVSYTVSIDHYNTVLNVQ